MPPGSAPGKNPTGICLLKVNNRSTRIRCEICSKSTVKTQERPHWDRSGAFVANFEHISHCSIVCIINFEHVIPGCEDASNIGMDVPLRFELKIYDI